MASIASAAPSIIRTPDQRLRVFVSSTLKELAPERDVARSAIERLAAAPVMFELGARPHPPRELYRAYLGQSDIFVGIYWERYGWVAPGEDVSGLEDEYNLVPDGMPRLIYVKEPAGVREERLTELIDRLRNDDTASYKPFRDTGELGPLLIADLAVLLAERFDQSRLPAPATAEAPVVARPSSARLPVPLTHLVGRDRDIEAVAGLLGPGGERLVTLMGPGGVGKTRVAIEVGRSLEEAFDGDVTFVPLAPVDAAAQVPSAIAQALGVLDTGDVPLDRKLVASVRDRAALIVLDNFEQVVDAAPLVADLLEASPRLKVLVTSRTLLRISGERSYEVGPLELSPPRSGGWRPGDPLAPAVDLFVQRARSVKPDFELTPENADAVERITAMLGGLPLAIELAAARIRLLSTESLVERLDRPLPVLVGGRRDAPARQQTVRNTIEWSTHLLTEDERTMLWQLGVFAGRFSLEAVEAVAEEGTDVLGLLGALVDASLVRQQERHGRTYLTMLATVREYALEQLDTAGLLAPLRRRHAEYYADWGSRLGTDFDGPRQRESLVALADERDDLRSSQQELLASGDWEYLARSCYALYPYWWVSGLLGEVRGRMDELLRSGGSVSDRARAIALWFSSMTTFFERQDATVIGSLTESARLFARAGDDVGEGWVRIGLGLALTTSTPPAVTEATKTLTRAVALFHEAGVGWGESIASLPLGRLAYVQGDVPGAIEHFTRALELSEADHNDFATSVVLSSLGWMKLLSGSVAEAVALQERSLDLCMALDFPHGVAYQLEAFLGVAGVRGDVERAGLLGGAARSLRERLGLFNPSDAVLHLAIVERIRSGPGAAPYDRAFEAGRRLSVPEAAAIAHEVAATAAAERDPRSAGPRAA